MSHGLVAFSRGMLNTKPANAKRNGIFQMLQPLISTAPLREMTFMGVPSIEWHIQSEKLK